MHHDLYDVVSFDIVGDYTLRLTFDDGTQQVIDFEPVLYGEMWGPLRDLALFNQVTLDPEAKTIVWPNGADFDPETLRHWPEYEKRLMEPARRFAQVTV